MDATKIPLCVPLIEQAELDAVTTVLKSGWLTHGPKNSEFERLFAEHAGTKHAIAMNSGTSALFLAVIAHGITGEVLVPSFTFVASANAIATAGASPVFVEINEHDCNVDVDLLEGYLTPRTEAIMPVHFAGQCCDMDRVTAFAEKHNLVIIEDSAETIGGLFGDKVSGSWGTGCFSFFPTKNITTGEGGMLTTSDDAIASRIRTLIGHGIDKTTYQRSQQNSSWHRAATLRGYNFRMSNLLAAIGVEQMKKVDAMNNGRRQRSAYLTEQLQNVEELTLPVENPNSRHVYQMYTVRCRDGASRDSLVNGLKERGIGASVHFDPPVHKHPAYAEFADIPLPVTDRVAATILTLPMFPQITEGDLDRVAATVEDILAHG